MTKIAVRIKELREDKKMSARELAKALQISDRAVQRWEKSERTPNAEMIYLLAKFFGVSADYLLGLSDL